MFAAALVHEPKLLIVDEPTVGLDPKSIRELKTLLRKLADGGTTVFLSTHTLDIAQELADRIGIIDRGRLLGCGTMTDLQKQAAMRRQPGRTVPEDHGGGRGGRLRPYLAFWSELWTWDIPPVADQARVFRRLRLHSSATRCDVALEQRPHAAGHDDRVEHRSWPRSRSGVGLYLFNQLAVNNIPGKGAIVEALFDLLFFTLGSMLVFSTGIILFASLFTSPEARFLLARRPGPTTSSPRSSRARWRSVPGAFVILGIPIFLAYGIITGVPWYFYALLPVYPPRLRAPARLGLGDPVPPVVRYMPRNRRQFFVLVGAWSAALAASGCIAWSGHARSRSLVAAAANCDDLIGQFDLIRSSLAPSHWMTRGVMAAARGDLAGRARAAGPGLEQRAVALRDRGVGRPAALPHRLRPLRRRRARKKIYGTSRLDRVMDALVFYLDQPTRVLVVKDFRTFRRDPTQWALLVLFGAPDAARGDATSASTTRPTSRVMDKYAISLMNLVRHGDPALRRAEPLHLPAHQPGRAEVLDPRAHAGEPRSDSARQVRLRRDRVAAHRRGADPDERRAARPAAGRGSLLHAVDGRRARARA